MKKILILTLAVISLVCVGCNKKVDNKDDGIIQNVNEGVITNQKVGDLEFKNTSLTWNGNASLLETIITNTSDSDIYVKEFIIRFNDKDDNVIASLTGLVGKTIKAGESFRLNSSSYKDLTNAYNVYYEIVD